MKGIEFKAIEGKSNNNVKYAILGKKMYLELDLSAAEYESNNDKKTPMLGGMYGSVDVGDNRKVRMSCSFFPAKAPAKKKAELAAENDALKARLAALEAKLNA